MKTDGLKARPVGRGIRLLLGVLLVAEGGRHLVGTSLWLAATTAGVVLGEFLFYVALHLIIVRYVSSVNRWAGAFAAVTPVLLVFVLGGPQGMSGTLGLPRSRGRVSAFGHIVFCIPRRSPVVAVGNVRSTFSKGLVDALVASTGPAASRGAPRSVRSRRCCSKRRGDS